MNSSPRVTRGKRQKEFHFPPSNIVRKVGSKMGHVGTPANNKCRCCRREDLQILTVEFVFSYTGEYTPGSFEPFADDQTIWIEDPTVQYRALFDVPDEVLSQTFPVVKHEDSMGRDGFFRRGTGD